MCGINGFNWDDAEKLSQMIEATAHRGPDGDGAYTEAGVSLGHNRLAIIDLSERGAQPMGNSDSSTVIVYNGEIYNFRELKEELKEYPFKSDSDTEVILAAYDRWGTAAFERFNGIFAFALWDQKKQELLLARDRSGVKPLYYFWDGTRFIFSSEIKAILTHDVPREIDRESLVHYLRVLYVPGPNTLFKHVKKLEAGHMLSLAGMKLTDTEFVSTTSHTGSMTDESLRTLIDEAVERQLVSDRPLGIYLSGGFDSSILLDSVSRIRDNVQTFSVGFELDGNSDKYNVDQDLAKRTAKHYGTTHHEVMMTAGDAARHFESAVWHMDEPNGNPTALAMKHLAEFTKPMATVVFSGDGGDELFGGYERYQLSLLSSYYRKLPRPIRAIGNALVPRLAKLDTAPGVERFAQFLLQKDDTLTRIVQGELPLDATRRFFEKKFFSEKRNGSFENLFMDVDRRSWLVDEDLLRTDKMAMASGVEVRVPLLDNEVVAFASNIPQREKITFFRSKRMLRRAFKDRLPEYLYTEPKRGWFTPAAKWLRHESFLALGDEVLVPGYSETTRDLFKWDEIRRMREAHLSGTEYNLTMLWALMVLQVWTKRFNATLQP